MRWLLGSATASLLGSSTQFGVGVSIYGTSIYGADPYGITNYTLETDPSTVTITGVRTAGTAGIPAGAGAVSVTVAAALFRRVYGACHVRRPDEPVSIPRPRVSSFRRCS